MVVNGFHNAENDMTLALYDFDWPEISEAAARDVRVAEAVSKLTAKQRRQLWPR
jgi:hypothetical protein